MGNASLPYVLGSSHLTICQCPCHFGGIGALKSCWCICNKSVPAQILDLEVYVMRDETKQLRHDLDMMRENHTRLISHCQDGIEKIFEKLESIQQKSNTPIIQKNTKHPHRCPLCHGKGHQTDINSTTDETWTCHGCAGQGIVWG